MDQQAPAQARGKKVKVPEIVEAPPPFVGDARPSVMTLRVYDWCPEERAHLDPSLLGPYAEDGI